MNKQIKIILIGNILLDFVFFIVISNWFINFTVILFTQLFLVFYCILCFIYWKEKYREIYLRKLKENENKK